MNAIILISILGILAMVSEFIGLKKLIFPLIVLSLTGILVYNGITFWNHPHPHYGMMVHDNFSIAFGSLLIVVTLFWFLLSRVSYAENEFNAGDHYALILFSTVGGLMLVSFSNMSMLFLGVEILSIPLYILAGSNKKELRSIESSIKYFILGSFATGIMLLGIALIYGATGSFDFPVIAAFSGKMTQSSSMFYVGVTLLSIAFAFKVSAVPFHFWVPDVYSGAPTFITAFMSTFVKIAAFGAFYHMLEGIFDTIPTYLSNIFIALSAITILVGNIAASNQSNVKRMLAFSGVSQAGYMLMIFPILDFDSVSALFVYLAGYAIANLIALYVVYTVEKSKGEASIENFSGLAKSNPLLAFVLALSLLSLAGIPPAAGFFGKFYLFTQVLKSGNISLVLIAVIGSLISVYYYFKTIISMYSGVSIEESVSVKSFSVTSFVLILMAVLIVLIGMFPDCLIQIGTAI